jgi:hypothetical protein
MSFVQVIFTNLKLKKIFKLYEKKEIIYFTIEKRMGAVNFNSQHILLVGTQMHSGQERVSQSLVRSRSLWRNRMPAPQSTFKCNKDVESWPRNLLTLNPPPIPSWSECNLAFPSLLIIKIRLNILFCRFGFLFFTVFPQIFLAVWCLLLIPRV